MITQATRHDLEQVKTLLRAYAQEQRLPYLQDTEDVAHVEGILLSIFAGRGFVLLDDQGRGMLIAIVSPSFWLPSVRELHELAFFVLPQHRNGTVGGRLWLRFNALASAMLAEKRVSAVVTSRVRGLDIERYGYERVHETLVRV